VIKSKIIRGAKHVMHMWENRNAYRILLQDGVNWILIAQDRNKQLALENAVMNFRVS
jgi:hypothetical protein